MKLNSWLLPCKKTNSRYIKDSKLRGRTTELPEENLGELFSDLKVQKYFYKQDTKDTKSSHKMRCFTHSTPALSYLNAGKRQVTNKGNIMGKKNFTREETQKTYMKDDSLIKHPTEKNKQRIWIDISPKKIYKCPTNTWQGMFDTWQQINMINH